MSTRNQPGKLAGARASVSSRLRDAVRRSPALTRFLVRVAGRAQALRDRGLTRSGRWRRRAGDETRYWEDALTADDAREAFSERLDPEAPLEDDSLIRAVDEVDAEVVEILDVGSGPLTSVGKTHRDRRLKIVAVDPLADDYARILREAGIDAPVVPVACGGEEIAEHLGEDSFDVAYALNALDHCADPMLVLDNMRRVVRPGGRIALTHMRNEGERNGYFGIHFWNLDCQDGRFVVWNRDERHDVAAELGDVEIDCWLGAGWVSCLIRPQA